jgi:predicted DNA-binding transcriptional regulator AlpA
VVFLLLAHLKTQQPKTNFNMFSDEISFNDMPQAMAYLIGKVERLETLLNVTKSELPETDKWFNLQELCSYLPDKPARQTVYGWIGQKLIPYHKKGKKLQFLKSEIDAWLIGDKHKSVAELQEDAAAFVADKKGGLK